MTHILTLAGAELHARPSGALWWPALGLLAVGDLHLGRAQRGALFGGAPLPPYDAAETLDRLEAEIAALDPAHVASLGDGFDDRGAAGRLDEGARDRLAALAEGRDWTWVTGNHDPAPPPHLRRSAAAGPEPETGEGTESRTAESQIAPPRKPDRFGASSGSGVGVPAPPMAPDLFAASRASGVETSAPTHAPPQNRAGGDAPAKPLRPRASAASGAPSVQSGQPRAEPQPHPGGGGQSRSGPHAPSDAPAQARIPPDAAPTTDPASDPEPRRAPLRPEEGDAEPDAPILSAAEPQPHPGGGQPGSSPHAPSDAPAQTRFPPAAAPTADPGANPEPRRAPHHPEDAPPRPLPGAWRAEFRPLPDGPVLRHISGGAGPEISAHWHPKARIGPGRRRCFLWDGRRLVLPAFGAFTGGLDVDAPPLRALMPEGLALLCCDTVRPAPLSALRAQARRRRG